MPMTTKEKLLEDLQWKLGACSADELKILSNLLTRRLDTSCPLFDFLVATQHAVDAANGKIR